MVSYSEELKKMQEYCKYLEQKIEEETKREAEKDSYKKIISEACEDFKDVAERLGNILLDYSEKFPEDAIDIKISFEV